MTFAHVLHIAGFQSVCLLAMATSDCQFTHGAKTWDLSPLTKEDGYTFKGVDGTVTNTFTLNVCNGTQGCDARTGLNGGGATMDDGTTCTALGNVRSGQVFGESLSSNACATEVTCLTQPTHTPAPPCAVRRRQKRM